MSQPVLAPHPVLAPRLVRSYVQSIAATPEQVFPLLCPVREAEWLPGWRYEMIHSASGIAEPGAIFSTPCPTGGRTTWLMAGLEAPRRVHLVYWRPDEVVVDIEINIVADGDRRSKVEIRYTSTATADAGRQVLDDITEDVWTNMMTFWQTSMNDWFAANPAPSP